MVEYVERRLHRSALFISGATGPVEPWKLIKENLKISSSIVELKNIYVLSRCLLFPSSNIYMEYGKINIPLLEMLSFFFLYR